MIKKLKNLVIQMVAGANIASVVLMLLSGYSDRLDPTEHPLLSTAGMAFPVFLLINMAFLLFWLTFKWKKIWIPIVGYALAYVPITIYLPLKPSQELPEGTIKLLSYNVCQYSGYFKYDDAPSEIARFLEREAPDIVCLQEDTDTKHRQVFAKYEKAGLVHNDTNVIINRPGCRNALGIHTRYPILRRERIPYTSRANGSVAWWLKVGDDTLIVVNNHFESCHLSKIDRRQYRQILTGKMPGDSARAESKLLLVKLAEANAKRAGQIRAVRSYAEAHSRYPVIVCGDFNDNPISYSRHAMAEALTDCYAETGWGLGLSYNQKAFSLRIDHIFCNEKLEPYNCKIDGEMDASDHNPVLCWLKIRPKP